MKWFLGFYCRIVTWGILGLFGLKPSQKSIQKLYDLMNELINKRREFLRFLNYGYHDAQSSPLGLLPHYDPGQEIYSSQLYAAVVSPRFMPYLAGKKVLEVGCGRGGGIAMIHAHLGVGEAIGLDLSVTAIENCRTWFKERKGLTFVAGDACQLPYADGSIDVVINVESAHGYPDLRLFLTQVARVLTPSGLFFFADFMPPAMLHKTERMFAELKFNIVDRCDITANVLEGIALDQQRKMDSLYSEKIPRAAKNMLREFMGSEGTMIHRRFSSRSLVYVRYILARGDKYAGSTTQPS